MTLFFGYLGQKNFGDDLLLEIAIKHENKWQKLSSKDSFIRHLELIWTCDKLVLLGGIFQDLTSIRSNFYYFFVLLFAKFLGKKLISKATGIGPLKSTLTKFITFLAYRLMDEISVRDEYSSNFLEQRGIKHSLVKDLGFSFHYDETKVDFSKVPQGKFNLVSINPYLETINTEGKLEIICDPKQKPSSKDFIYTTDFNTHEIYYIIKNCSKSLITQRFHIAVLAILAGVEFQTTTDCHKVLPLTTCTSPRR